MAVKHAINGNLPDYIDTDDIFDEAKNTGNSTALVELLKAFLLECMVSTEPEEDVIDKLAIFTKAAVEGFQSLRF